VTAVDAPTLRDRAADIRDAANAARRALVRALVALRHDWPAGHDESRDGCLDRLVHALDALEVVSLEADELLSPAVPT
jgi:hypothetical protein